MQISSLSNNYKLPESVKNLFKTRHNYLDESEIIRGFYKYCSINKLILLDEENENLVIKPNKELSRCLLLDNTDIHNLDIYNLCFYIRKIIYNN